MIWFGRGDWQYALANEAYQLSLCEQQAVTVNKPSEIGNKQLPIRSLHSCSKFLTSDVFQACLILYNKNKTSTLHILENHKSMNNNERFDNNSYYGFVFPCSKGINSKRVYQKSLISTHKRLHQTIFKIIVD